MTETPDFFKIAGDVLSKEMSDEDMGKVQLMQPHMVSVLTGQITPDEALKLADMEWNLLTEEERSETVEKGRIANKFAKAFFDNLGGKNTDNDD